MGVGQVILLVVSGGAGGSMYFHFVWRGSGKFRN